MVKVLMKTKAVNSPILTAINRQAFVWLWAISQHLGLIGLANL
jgi:hypothetical protein